MSAIGDKFGDDSMLMDFDPDEFIQKVQNEKSLQNSVDNDSKKKGGVHNPYARKNNVSSSNSSNRSPSSGVPVAVAATTTSSFFGSNSKFSTGNIDSTRYMALSESSTRPGNAGTPSPSTTTNKRFPLSNIEKNQSTSSPSSIKKLKLDNKPNPTDDIVINPTTISNYTQTLTKYFGYQSFRNGQLQIIHSIISNQSKNNDACVFWSTGSGKSLCYQIPPLHMKKIAIVVSPLISLMEDQVSKLNGLFLQEEKRGNTTTSSSISKKKKDMAIYLGSGQLDMNADSKALTGEYSFVYCTPEKLLSQGGSFLDSLGFLHQRGNVCSDNGIVNSYGSNICLIAIDERYVYCLYFLTLLFHSLVF